jgi:hypothetical protein
VLVLGVDDVFDEISDRRQIFLTNAESPHAACPDHLYEKPQGLAPS